MTDRSRLPAAVTFLLACLAMGPVLLSRGYVLIGDMTFVPRQPWKGAWLGLDGSVPRAVPADAFVSVLSHVVAGDLLQKAVLVGALWFAALGTIRLLRTVLGAAAVVAPTAAATLYLWNPWVLERIAIGHWGLLVGYAALPWLTATAIAVRRGDARVLALLPTLAVAAFGSPTGGIAAALVAVVVLVERGRARRLVSVVGLVVLVNLPWIVPGLLGNNAPTDPGGVAAFAARSDTPLGVVGSLLTFGGIWKQSIVPGERDSWLLVVLALCVTLAGLAVLLLSARVGVRATVTRRLLVLALVGFVLALLPATGPGRDLVTSLVDHVPGAGILRDSQKWLLLFVLPVCVGVGLAVDAVRARLHRSGRGTGWLLVSLLVPLVLLPSLAWGIAGKLDPVTYPQDWARVRSVLDGQPAADRRTVVLPWSAYHRYPWNDGRATLDPALRFFPGEVLTNDDLTVGGDRTVTGEDPVAARIGAVLAHGGDLGSLLDEVGIRYVLVERDLSDSVPAAVLTGLAARSTTLYDGPGLLLLDLGHGRSRSAPGYAVVAVIADVLALGAVLGWVVFYVVVRIRRKKHIFG